MMRSFILFSLFILLSASPMVYGQGVNDPCVPTATSVCLGQDRFEVSVDTLGMTSPAQELADSTAGFPFTNPTFFDLLVSVTDGSSANGQFWVTYSMFSPSAFTLTVTDHVSGETKTYDHDTGDPLFVLDKMAFAGDNNLSIDGTLSGSWYSPARDGEGFIFDIAVLSGVPTLVLYYFTYENNNSGRQAWVVGAAPLIGNSASVPVIIADGTQFGPSFNPDDVNRVDWGHVKVTFLECNRALVESGSVIFPSVRYELQRLSPSPTGVAGVCQPPTLSAKGPAPDSASVMAVNLVDGGYSGSWYQAERNGEGFIFNIAMINDVNTLAVYYFTFENNTSGRQAWLVGAAPIIGNTADVPLVITAGTQFGDPFNKDDVQRTPWGNVVVTWQSCTQGHVAVTSESFGDISFDISKITPPTIGTSGDCAQ